MGGISDWLKRIGINVIDPVADLERIVGCVHRIVIDVDLLERKPQGSVDIRLIDDLQQEARKFGTSLTAAIAMNPRYRVITRSPVANWKLHAARDSLTAAEVRLEVLRGRIAAGKAAADAVSEIESARGKKPADARWARLDPVKEWAFQQRADNPLPRSRASVIKEILPEVRNRAKAAGATLSGTDDAVIRTVTGWFKDAGIK